jgi:hypothetical protein
MPRFKSHHTAVGEYDDGTRAGCGDRSDECDVVSRKVKVGAVEAFGFFFLFQTDEYDTDIGPSCQVYCLFPHQGGCRVRTGRTITWRVVHAPFAQGKAEFVEGDVDAGGVDVGAAAALVARLLSEFAQDRDVDI